MTETHEQLFNGEVITNLGFLVIQAVIPSRHSEGYVLENGALPSAFRDSSNGETYEQTLLRISRRVLHKAASIDFATWVDERRIVFYTDPVEHDTVKHSDRVQWHPTKLVPKVAEFAEGLRIARLPLDFGRNLE